MGYARLEPGHSAQTELGSMVDRSGRQPAGSYQLDLAVESERPAIEWIGRTSVGVPRAGEGTATTLVTVHVPAQLTLESDVSGLRAHLDLSPRAGASRLARPKH